MTHTQKLIKHLFPNKIITQRLLDLIHYLSKKHVENAYRYTSIEKDNNCREFCYFMLDELMILYQQCPVSERSLYEIITLSKQVKAYIDFEYYTNNNLAIQSPHIGPNCFLKILYYLLDFQRNTNFKTTNYTSLAMQQFLVLES